MRQKKLLERACKVLPAGGFGNFDPSLIIREGRGSRVWDEDGKEYIDYLIGSGPMILGHGHPEIVEVLSEQLHKGMTFFANNAKGIELAEEICSAVPCAEQLRFVSSGGEANMFAMRLARAFTRRSKILKFEGGYHGMSAEAQMSLAPNCLTDYPTSVADSAGISRSIRDEILTAPFNNLEVVQSLIADHADQIAAIIVEPLQRIIQPIEGFLKGLRDECSKHGIVLIFDEIVTGFRLSYGGGQELYGVTPDLCTLGKIIGGGFPLAAIAGKKMIMDHFDERKVGRINTLMQVGTLSGNPVASTAGLKTLEILRRPGQYEKLRANGNNLLSGISMCLRQAGHTHKMVGDATLFDVIFTETPVLNYRDGLKADKTKAKKLNSYLREQGILKAQNKMYISLALNENDLRDTLAIFSASALNL